MVTYVHESASNTAINVFKSNYKKDLKTDAEI